MAENLEKRIMTALKERYLRAHRGESYEENIEVGDVCIVKNADPREMWPLGFITEICPDHKGSLRVVKVKSRLGKLQVNKALYFHLKKASKLNCRKCRNTQGQTVRTNQVLMILQTPLIPL